MTQKNYTHICLIVDESGSMTGSYNETILSLDNFIAKQKEHPGKCTISFVGFDTFVRNYLDFVDLKVVPSVKELYKIHDMTALYDALGKSIVKTGEHLSSLREDERPEKVLIVVLTDGQENSSREFSLQKLSEMVKHQQDKYSWDFIFLGADLNSKVTYANVGVKSANYASFSKLDMIDKMNMLSHNISGYRSASLEDKDEVNLTCDLDSNEYKA